MDDNGENNSEKPALPLSKIPTLRMYQEVGRINLAPRKTLKDRGSRDDLDITGVLADKVTLFLGDITRLQVKALSDKYKNCSKKV